MPHFKEILMQNFLHFPQGRATMPGQTIERSELGQGPQSFFR